jgi:hypothetical protein
MDLTRRDRTPAVIVDDALQTRLPLTEDELVLQAALTSIAAGQMVDSWILRDMVGAGFVHIGTCCRDRRGPGVLARPSPAPAAAIQARMTKISPRAARGNRSSRAATQGYPRLVANADPRSLANLHITRQRPSSATLAWLQAGEAS